MPGGRNLNDDTRSDTDGSTIPGNHTTPGRIIPVELAHEYTPWDHLVSFAAG